MTTARYDELATSPLTRYLCHHCGLSFDPRDTSTRVFIVGMERTFRMSAKFPNLYLQGSAVERIGRSSVRYRLSLFEQTGDPNVPLHADYLNGHFASDEGADKILDRFGESAFYLCTLTHVYVDPENGERPVKELSENIARNLKRIHVSEE